jgi:sugar/nucleoside kinase (ribokinase family)
MRASVCLGDNTIDRYLAPVSVDLIGGNGANVAVGLSGGGIRSAYVGPVGADPAGARVLAEFAANGVDVAAAPVLEGVSTAVTEIALLEGGERRFVSEASPAIFLTSSTGSARWPSIARFSSATTPRPSACRSTCAASTLSFGLPARRVISRARSSLLPTRLTAGRDRRS